MMNNKKFAIAIDGPVAAGKGTIAVQLAKELHGFYLYTGAMYRSVALYCIEHGIDLTNEDAVVASVPNMTFSIKENTLLVDGRDVTERIKQKDTASGASVVAVYPKVREALVKVQQLLANEAIAQGQIVISEGRDTGTVVFPDSPLKIYLTATDETRAKRRLLQYQALGKQVSFDEVLAEIRERDKRDKGRDTDPLPSNPEELGYVIVDDSEMSEEGTLTAIRDAMKERNLLE
jgi:cytidylate kinase